MQDPTIFNFHRSSLVRMSKDDIIDQYNIFPIKIGQGNDGVVYKGRQNFDGGQWRAVKKIHRKYIQKEEYLATQIEILKRLDHPGVLKLFQVFDDSEYVFIVTELCSGNSLYKQLKRRGCFNQAQARQIFKKILQIISYCHQSKIIHRDLKLQNLVYCSQQTTPQSLRLIDFGMSFQWLSSPRIQIKKTFLSNKVVGTIYYMAPEIHNETYDHRVDIWSAGVMLFYLLTGELPFCGEQDEEILEAIRQKRVPYELLRQKNCSDQVIDLLKRIFVTESKRISVQEILAHKWFTQSPENTLQHLQLNRKNQQYFPLIPFKQFFTINDYYHYYRQKITQLSCKQQNIGQSLSFHNHNQHLTVNWNNLYQFLNLDPIEKTIKIYLSYRMSYQKSHRYISIFDHFKSKKEKIEISTLLQHLHLQYQKFKKLNGNNHTQHIIESHRSHQKIRKLSIDVDKYIHSAHNVYKELLTFLQNNKYRSVGYVLFVTWMSDYNDFDKGQLEFLRNSLRHKTYQTNPRNIINDEILNIHKVVRNSYIQRKLSNKSKLAHQTQTSSKTMKNHIYKHSKLTIEVQEVINQDSPTKRTVKKSIKQNILESISPTFTKKINLTKKNFTQGPQTQRPTKGSRLLDFDKTQSGFFHGIRKIISFL